MPRVRNYNPLQSKIENRRAAQFPRHMMQYFHNFTPPEPTSRFSSRFACFTCQIMQKYNTPCHTYSNIFRNTHKYTDSGQDSSFPITGPFSSELQSIWNIWIFEFACQSPIMTCHSVFLYILLPLCRFISTFIVWKLVSGLASARGRGKVSDVARSWCGFHGN